MASGYLRAITPPARIAHLARSEQHSTQLLREVRAKRQDQLSRKHLCVLCVCRSKSRDESSTTLACNTFNLAPQVVHRKGMVPGETARVSPFANGIREMPAEAKTPVLRNLERQAGVRVGSRTQGRQSQDREGKRVAGQACPRRLMRAASWHVVDTDTVIRVYAPSNGLCASTTLRPSSNPAPTALSTWAIRLRLTIHHCRTVTMV